jgi:tRNA(Ile)-lysidine synthase
VAAQALLPADGQTGRGEHRQSLNLRLLREWPPSPRRHALRLAFAAVAGDAQELTQRHLQALERLVRAGKTGDRLDLPRGAVAVLRRDELELRRGAATGAPPEEPVMLEVPGECRFGSIILTAASAPPAPGQWVEVDAEAAGASLCVRQRKSGDRFQPLGMAQEKKLQDFLTDAHIPRDARDAVPLFVSPRGIAWVGGLRIAEWAKPRPGRPTVFLSFRPA